MLSFSRPEKLPLKIHTGSSGTIYSYWVEKALLFPNWSSFSRQLPSAYVSNFSQIFSQPWGGGRGSYGRGGICSLLAGPLRQGKKSWSAGGLSRADRYSRQFLTTRPNRPVRQGKQGGPVQEGSRSGRYGGRGGCTYIITS